MQRNNSNEDNNGSNNDQEAVPPKWVAWKVASRPHTLTASIAPVVVGYALTYQLIQQHSNMWMNSLEHGECRPGDYDSEEGELICSNITNRRRSIELAMAAGMARRLAIEFGVYAGLIQISTNLHNDYADFVKGADTDARVGHARATQKGWLSPRETCAGCVVCLVASVILAAVCFLGSDCSGGKYDPVMMFIVASSTFNAVAYTGGPFPLGYIGLEGVSIGYSGLGDLFVFLYFGLVATLAVPYMFLTKLMCLSSLSSILQLLTPAFLSAIPIGFLATAIIVVNNLRDRNTDVHAGKRTLAVRFGKSFAQWEYLLLVLASYVFCIIIAFYAQYTATTTTSKTNNKAWTHLLPLLSIPLSIPQCKAVAFGGKDGPALNVHVGGTAKLQMIYCILMALAIILSCQ